VNRLYGVLDTRLKDSEFMAGAYSIADMATYPWVIVHANLGQTLDDFPHMKRWFDTIQARPAVVRGYAVMEETRRADGAGIHVRLPRRTEQGRTAEGRRHP
jgi:GSH-dependent disulfide-bond oxidoreductase